MTSQQWLLVLVVVLTVSACILVAATLDSPASVFAIGAVALVGAGVAIYADRSGR